VLYILDTNILTALHLANPKVLKAIQGIGNARVAITIVTKVELLRGRIDFLLKADRGEDLRRAQRLLIETEERLNEIEILMFDDAAIAQADALMAHSSMRKAGRGDLLIASVALSHQATLVTRNLKDFQRFPNLKLVNWLD
jgi:tRNA(fMet)-specific endonuclease VapC